MPPVSQVNYKQSLKAAAQELTELMEQQEGLEVKMEEVRERAAIVRRALNSLGALCDISPPKEYPHLYPSLLERDVGFTDAIREVFRHDDMAMFTAVGVRDQLQAMGFDIAKYTNPLASIHTILKRLQRNKEVVVVPSSDGRVLYGGGSGLKGKK